MPQTERTGLTALLATPRRGDTVVIRRLDRLSRSLKDLIYLVERLDVAGVDLLATKLRIPLQIQLHLAFAFEAGY